LVGDPESPWSGGRLCHESGRPLPRPTGIPSGFPARAHCGGSMSVLVPQTESKTGPFCLPFPAASCFVRRVRTSTNSLQSKPSRASQPSARVGGGLAKIRGRRWILMLVKLSTRRQRKTLTPSHSWHFLKPTTGLEVDRHCLIGIYWYLNYEGIPTKGTPY
jgi:hypothetical protein